mmetsp:Transcript_33103/g.86980  ORF Transcript_33103/g.86980 Transcript_33103/m.86980 type:complete len:112 (+) Transcript_33103:2-337(+)
MLRPLFVIALGVERIGGEVAAFETADVAVDELDIELWERADEGDAKTARQCTDEDGDDGSPAARAMLGTCTIGIAGLLAGELSEINAMLPTLEPHSNRVVAHLRLRIEVRR